MIHCLSVAHNLNYVTCSALNDAEFITSAVDAGGVSEERLPEVALVGRSNVGKSSLINALVAEVARTSATPGKTRLANFYRVTGRARRPFFLVDLPGYGYARGGRRVRASSGHPGALPLATCRRSSRTAARDSESEGRSAR